MKKIIGILGVVLIAITLCTNAHINKENTNLSLTSLFKLSTANAEMDCLYNYSSEEATGENVGFDYYDGEYCDECDEYEAICYMTYTQGGTSAWCLNWNCK